MKIFSIVQHENREEDVQYNKGIKNQWSNSEIF
jgi:hypothetical protein